MLSNNSIYGLKLSGGTIYSGATELSLLFPQGGSTTINNNTNYFTYTGTTYSAATTSYMTSPELYGARHQDVSLGSLGYTQAQINANFPGANAFTFTTIDTAAWQCAVNEATSTGKVLFAYGDYYISTGITIPKYINRLTIEGNGCKLYANNNNVYTMLGRIVPTGQTEALNLMNNFKIQIRHIDFIGNGKTQRGFYSGPSYGASYEGLRFTSLAQGMWLEFALNTTVNNNQFFDCISGGTATMGSWVYPSSSPLSGETATNSNSQSNVTIFKNCRAYMGGGDYGFGIFSSSGCRITDCIIEGSQCRNAIEYDAYGSTNVYSFWTQNIHAELNYDASVGLPGTGSLIVGTGAKSITVATNYLNSEYPAGYPIRLSSAAGNTYMDGTITSYIGTTLTVNITTTVGTGGTHSDYNVTILLGCTNSIIKHKALGGIYVCDGIYSQYKAIAIDSYASLSNTNIKVSNIFSLVPDHNGCYFRTRGTGNAWYFDWNDQLYSSIADIANKFAIDNGVYSGQPIGTAPSSATISTMGNGNNHYVVVSSPR